ncbi:MAG: hypothetical protein JJ992_15890 [Planctomycetes bacterium]|nr:hypothetical protein [Planctomycetota bacterium]
MGGADADLAFPSTVSDEAAAWQYPTLIAPAEKLKKRLRSILVSPGF